MTIAQLLAEAMQHQQAGRLREAVLLYRQVIAQNPRSVEALNNLGVIMRAIGRPDDAVECYRHAIAVRPDMPDLHHNLAMLLTAEGRLDEALEVAQRAVEIHSHNANAHDDLGQALMGRGDVERALESFERAAGLDPGNAIASNNLGAALHAIGRRAEALKQYEITLQKKPDYAPAHYNRGTSLLLDGRFEEGWREFEWRWSCSFFDTPRRNYAQPQWTGEALDGRTIFVYPEQGLGDTIQFARYVPLLAARGAKVTVESPPELLRLLKSVSGAHQVIEPGAAPPPFDFHCPLLSLPLAFGTTLETIPADVPYFRADDSWRERLVSDSSRLKIGLVWAGSTRHKADRARSISLNAFAPLASINDVSFYSLQKGERAKEIEQSPFKIIDFTGELNDFADTASLVNALDLVISVDTSVAHLAGALAKPVWTLVPFAPDWRWMIDREDSPWYPTMRLFRQPARDDWQTPIARIAESLKTFRAD